MSPFAPRTVAFPVLQEVAGTVRGANGDMGAVGADRQVLEVNTAVSPPRVVSMDVAELPQSVPMDRTSGRPRRPMLDIPLAEGKEKKVRRERDE